FKQTNKNQQKFLACKKEEHVSVTLVNTALDSGTWEDLYAALINPVLKLPITITIYSAPFYYEEMRADKLECGKKLSYDEIVSNVRVLSYIAAVTRAVDDDDSSFFTSVVTFSMLIENVTNEVKKLESAWELKSMRQSKLLESIECTLLTYTDIQDCVDIVNERFRENESDKIVLALHQLNSAIKEKNILGFVKALKSPELNLIDQVSSSDVILYFKALRRCWKRNRKKEWSYGLEDVELSVRNVSQDDVFSSEVEFFACEFLTKLNKILPNRNLGSTSTALKAIERTINENSPYFKLFISIKKWIHRKINGFDCPLIIFYTSSGREVYVNAETCTYSWKVPENFMSESFYEAQMKIKNELTERWLVPLQARCKGFLLRKKIGDQLEYFRSNIGAVIKIQTWWRSVMLQQKYRMILADYQSRKCSEEESIMYCLDHYKNEEDKIVKIQAVWRGYRVRKAFLTLLHKPHPPFKVVCSFAHHLDFSTDDYQRDLQLQNLKGQVVQSIRRNQQLSQQIDAMDVKIGLLVQNRIALQDVVKHGKSLNELTKHHQQDATSQEDSASTKGLKSLTKVGRKMLEGYQQLFYALQTNPNYLAKLIFCLPLSRTTRFVQTVILTLFNYGSNPREEYLLLKLFKTALEEEVRCKFTKPSDSVTGNPLVLKMVVNYSRQLSKQNALRDIVGPLIVKVFQLIFLLFIKLKLHLLFVNFFFQVLEDKKVSFETNPVDIFRSWRNQFEMETGNASNLPYSVTQTEALAFEEIRKRLNNGIGRLESATLAFLHRIVDSRHLIPYGMLYIAKVLRNTLMKKFPEAPEKEILK
ncbi:hypothetical protein L9F63_014957, partial [Diploptera punctata]